jgi:hypothetical protein
MHEQDVSVHSGLLRDERVDDDHRRMMLHDWSLIGNRTNSSIVAMPVK